MEKLKYILMINYIFYPDEKQQKLRFFEKLIQYFVNCIFYAKKI